MTGLISNIQRCSLTDGPGLRTTVFMQGCSLRCFWCHNPETISLQPQLMHNKDKCIGCVSCPRDASVCPANALTVSGKEMAAGDVFAEVIKDLPFYGKDGGVTFSGGEPLVQARFLAAMLELCKASGINTAVDTAGCVPWANIESIIGLTDIFLYDIKAIDPTLHKSGTERNNRIVLKNLDRILLSEKNVIIRIPVIPGFNGGQELERIKTYANAKKHDYKNLIDIELLPYHDLGAVKYERRVDK